jgi:hypothetical protein
LIQYCSIIDTLQARHHRAAAANIPRQLAIRLATVIRDGIVERRLLAATRGSDFAPCLLAATTPEGSTD